MGRGVLVCVPFLVAFALHLSTPFTRSSCASLPSSVGLQNATFAVHISTPGLLSRGSAREREESYSASSSSSPSSHQSSTPVPDSAIEHCELRHGVSTLLTRRSSPSTHHNPIRGPPLGCRCWRSGRPSLSPRRRRRRGRLARIGRGIIPEFLLHTDANPIPALNVELGILLGASEFFLVGTDFGSWVGGHDPEEGATLWVAAV